MDRRAWVGIWVAVFGCLGTVYLLAAPIPKLPIGTANGVYQNPCCGTLTLRDGKMTLPSYEVNYVIETDKAGAYVLPDSYVGVHLPVGVYADRARYPLKLRLDDKTHPRTISLHGEAREFLFVR